MSGLNLQQRRAAALDGAGRSRDEIATEVSVTPKTVSAWRSLDDYKAVVERVRRSYEQEDVSVRSTARAAMTATDDQGRPDWRVRLAAAKFLHALGEDDFEEPFNEPDDPMAGVTFYDDAA